ncbi:hypothetical protein [Actinophytocola gossypii]|uniref:Uncharacterized protein n=1 Tax=Actinophytocola gossypii TaxID=2812003 RepID=A0ABT2J399_9PSEU|nr:hypothetical protein [Actinophytocola gossypii]MCT2582323.1 hypothetical protein [Actinophytocola gossypii]
MGTVLLVILLVVVLVIVLVAVGFAVALARKGKRRYADQAAGPGLAPDAPREWAGAHSPEAKLHRRLAAAARSLAAQPMGDAAAIEQRVTISQQILRLDQQLVAAATIPGNADRLAEIETLVHSVEQAVTRLATTGTDTDMDLLKRTQAELDAGESDR